MHVLENIRTFETRNFKVSVDACVEEFPNLSFDETGEVAQKIDNGEFVIFCARVRVTHSKLGEVGADYLGDCIYENYADFQDHREAAKHQRELIAKGAPGLVGSYFADMVREAITQARNTIRYSKEIYLRENAS